MNKYGASFSVRFGLCSVVRKRRARGGLPERGIGLPSVPWPSVYRVVTMAYAIGHISGCHRTPRSPSASCSRRPLPASQVIPYITAQVL